MTIELSSKFHINPQSNLIYFPSELDIETVLEALGNHFIKYVCFQGYEKILRSLGNNLHDHLANVDFLHEHLGNVFVGMSAPSFRITHSSEGIMQLHYYSERKGEVLWTAKVGFTACIYSNQVLDSRA